MPVFDYKALSCTPTGADQVTACFDACAGIDTAALWKSPDKRILFRLGHLDNGIRRTELNSN